MKVILTKISNSGKKYLGSGFNEYGSETLARCLITKKILYEANMSLRSYALGTGTGTSVRLQTICMVQIVHKSRDSPEVSVTAVAPAAAEHVLIASGRVLNTPRPVPAVFLEEEKKFHDVR